MSLLELRNVSKHFGAIHALNEVTLSLEPGQVVGLMGDNGAGKSTLVKVIAGNFPPSHGEILIDGKAVHFSKPVDARARGKRKGAKQGLADVIERGFFANTIAFNTSTRRRPPEFAAF